MPTWKCLPRPRVAVCQHRASRDFVVDPQLVPGEADAGAPRRRAGDAVELGAHHARLAAVAPRRRVLGCDWRRGSRAPPLCTP
jgi:hypothetical protein